MGRKKEPKGWVFEEELDMEPDAEPDVEASNELESGRPRPGAVLSAQAAPSPEA